MRRIPHQCRDESCRDELCRRDGALGDPRAEEWWDALTLSERIEFELAEVVSMLATILTEVRTHEGRRLRWMEKPLACAFADTSGILERLQGPETSST
jgi:hypothetical protein